MKNEFKNWNVETESGTKNTEKLNSLPLANLCAVPPMPSADIYIEDQSTIEKLVREKETKSKLKEELKTKIEELRGLGASKNEIKGVLSETIKEEMTVTYMGKTFEIEKLSDPQMYGKYQVNLGFNQFHIFNTLEEAKTEIAKISFRGHLSEISDHGYASINSIDDLCVAIEAFVDNHSKNLSDDQLYDLDSRVDSLGGFREFIKETTNMMYGLDKV